jgi:CheY-like chemotaxis protein
MSLDSLCVLVVDDDRDTADSFAALLQLWGHRPLVAYDGPAALHAAQAGRPDVVLLDIGLPGMDGYRVAQALAEPAEGEPKPVLIAVTGYAQERGQQRAAEAGCALFLAKPVDAVVVQDLLRMLAQERRKNETMPGG